MSPPDLLGSVLHHGAEVSPRRGNELLRFASIFRLLPQLSPKEPFQPAWMLSFARDDMPVHAVDCA